MIAKECRLVLPETPQEPAAVGEANPARTKSIGLKVSAEEYAQLDAAAQWCREVLLASVNDQDPKSAIDAAGSGHVALLAELAALRAILLKIFAESTAISVRVDPIQRGTSLRSSEDLLPLSFLL